ncbi:MAG: hypothetical protein QM705_06655 [Ancrocorticia sp.]
MFSNEIPQTDNVLLELGEPFIHAFIDAVADATDDYEEFRSWHPDWFATFAIRTAACFIHDRIWYHLVRRIEEMEDVVVLDKDPIRELRYQSRYLLRVKRHNADDKITTYPTETALAFWSNGQKSLEGFESHSLALGYRWDSDMRSIGEAILSYRTDLNTPIWSVTLERDAGQATGFTWTPIGPELPDLDLSSVLTEAEQGAS